MIENLENYYYDRGVSLASKNRLTLAIEEFKKAYAINENNFKLYNVMGLCFYSLGEFHKAKSLWLKSIDINKAEDNKAHSYLEDIESQYFNDIVVNFNKALEFAAKEKYKEAIHIFTSNDFPCYSFVKFINLLGLYFMAKGDEAQARETWKKALEIDRDNPVSLNYLQQNWDITSKKLGLLNKLRMVLKVLKA